MLENKIHNTIDLRKNGEDNPTIKHIPTSWDDKDLGDFHYNYVPEKKMSFITKFFFFSLVTFLFASSFAVFNFYKNGNSFSENNIESVINIPATISGGESNSISIIITNRNSIPIVSSYLVLSYESGENISGTNNQTQKRIDLGDIVSNGSVNSSSDIVLYGNEGDKRKLNATLFYSLSNNKAVYNKNLEPAIISIKSSPVSITVNSLKEMHVNNIYSFDILVKNNTSKDLENLIVSVRPPNDFVYASSSMTLLNKNPSWLIQNLSAGSQIKITMTGKLVGTIGTNENFTFYAGTSNKDSNSSSTNINLNTNSKNKLTNNSFDNYNLSITNIYSQISKSVLLADQYLDIKMSSDTYDQNVSLGDNISLEFTYKNNLNFPIDNVSISAKLSGNMIDTVNTNAVSGFFDASSTTAFWDKSTIVGLSQIPANGSGTFKLNIKVSRDFVVDGNIKMQIFAKGDRNAEDSVPNEQNISLEKSWTITQ